ncbi:helix-turn-helix domain-containing protein [Aureimonas ureilytica]|uniref:helix-turn-helix domain-containing protein n=1 Tax=Aureimonas ureilytica TaxID=401562 RepID=UPI00187CC668|nr:MarR family transcriptional regulator [Aureimonas ureilytica]
MTKRPGPRYAIIPADAVTDPSLQGPDLKVLALLGRHIDRKGWCVRSQGRMADELGIARGTLQRALGRLVSAGYVEVSHEKRRDGGQAANRYRVILDDQARADQLDLFSDFGSDAVRAEVEAPPASQMRHPLPHPGEAPPASPKRGTHKERPLQETSPSDIGAEPRARDVANDHRSEPVPTRTELPAGAVPPVRLNVEAVPFLPNPPATVDRSDLAALQDRLEAAAGAMMDPTAGTLGDVSAVLGWIVEGCDLERDILPTIAGRAATHRGKGIRRWSYFAEPVLEAFQRRTALAARIAASAEPAASIIPFDPKGASHAASSRFAPEPTGGRFAAAAARRRRGLAGGSAGGEDG